MDVERVAETFVELADTLVDEFDVLDLLRLLTSRAAELLGVDAAGLLLADPNGRLRVTVATSEDARMQDLLQIQDAEGPGLECYRTGTPVSVERLDDVDGRWPRFAAQASRVGFSSVLALPMRLRRETIGVLSLLGTSANAPVGHQSTRVPQAMADVATIAIVQYRLSEDRRIVTAQLQRALDSRVVIEQAKGALVSQLQISESDAFELLRLRARSTRRRLTDVADEVRRRGSDTDWAEFLHAYEQAKDQSAHDRADDGGQA